MLEWIESTRLAVWVGQSPSVWSMPTILTLHTTGLALLVGASWVLDLRLLGISRTVPLSAFHWVFPVVAIGLVVNAITGVLLFMKSATTWGTSLPFLVKMLLVAASVATLVPIRTHVLRGGVSDESVRVWAIASVFGWCAAVTAGRLLAYLMV
jgi:hypothetical protein